MAIRWDTTPSSHNSLWDPPELTPRPLGDTWQVGRDGAIAFGKALHEWALPSCTEVILEGNDVPPRALRFVADALQRREWARIVLRQWFVEAEGEAETHGLGARHRRQLLLPQVAQWQATSNVTVTTQ